MTAPLRYWRDLPKEEKRRIMKEKGTKAITFEQITELYETRISRTRK
jgi:chlorite dismutase